MKKFDYKHYVPVLRWKRGEWVALRELNDGDRDLITPFVEVVPKDFKDRASRPEVVEEKIEDRVQQIVKSWSNRILFLDLNRIEPSMTTSKGQSAFSFFSDVIRSIGAVVVPVVFINSDVNLRRAVKKIAKICSSGICVRLSSVDLYSRRLSGELRTLLADVGVDVRNAHLFVDLGIRSTGTPTLDVVNRLVPWLKEWRTYTVASGSFPKDLSGFSVGEHLHSRDDWNAWYDEVMGKTILTRIPTFSDFTTQHAKYEEPPERSNFSASIRYVADRAWVVMRGEGVFNEGGAGYAQWPANAKMLCRRSEYCGNSFSYGDKYIYEMAQQTAKTGNPETWLRAGVNHHVTFVARQVASLP